MVGLHLIEFVNVSMICLSHFKRESIQMNLTPQAEVLAECVECCSEKFNKQTSISCSIVESLSMDIG